MSRHGGSGPPSIEGMVSLKVDNLTYRTTPEDLREAFDKYGEVGDVYIPRDRFTKESRGFAFVRFHDKRDAEDAMDSMDGALLDGREVRCQMARYGRPQEPSRGDRDRRGGDRDRRGGDRDRDDRGGGRRGRSFSRSRSRSPRRRGGRDRGRSNSRSRSRNRSRSPVQQKRSRSKSYDRNGADASD